ncbi:hypothetical protein [Leisingera sp. ANG-S3]|uniref:hypothetical protein n=1 Tax=Leisingera sp. ANG-S3 TaxID=1577899 RepID=UPI0005800AEB|nr:hypothetical protein [Leisingera sp. ANG-S3]KIC23386.1 hypothetical protein RA23_15070 [Leisingera sp. ANG-S3]
MLTNHFSLQLLETFAVELETLGIAACDFLAAARHSPFDPGMPLASRANFAEACNVVCEIVLPRRTSLAHIRVSPHGPQEADLVVIFSSTASTGGREYMVSLSADTGRAMMLHGLFVAKAQKLGLKVA